MNTTTQKDLGPRWREIESSARSLQYELWNRRTELWGSSLPSDEVCLLEPGVGLELMGFKVESSDFLGELNHNGQRTEVAGFFDPSSKLVQVSRRFPQAVQLFTAAHELGHAVLHPQAHGLHRDRALSGSDQQRDWREREADWFATCFLMPAKLVRSRFVEAFGTDRFELTDDTAFALCAASVEQMLRTYKSPRDLSRRLADAIDYGGRRIAPLTSMFGVSTTAMAIRLEELGLVASFGHQRWRAASHLVVA